MFSRFRKYLKFDCEQNYFKFFSSLDFRLQHLKIERDTLFCRLMPIKTFSGNRKGKEILISLNERTGLYGSSVERQRPLSESSFVTKEIKNLRRRNN